MGSLESNKKVEEEKKIKTLTPNKTLTILSILWWGQIKAENNSNRLKKKVTQIPYLLYYHQNTLQQFNQVITTMGVIMNN